MRSDYLLKEIVHAKECIRVAKSDETRKRYQEWLDSYERELKIIRDCHVDYYQA